MIKMAIHFVSIVAAIGTLYSNALASEKASVFTSFIPPVVLDDPKRPGLAYEIVVELFRLAKEDFEIIPLPWARAQHMVKNTPHALIFPFSKTPTREKDFIWRVNIFNNQTHFITFDHTKLTAESARDKRIGVQLKSSWDNWLTEQGYKNVHRIPEAGEEFIKLLQNGRLDAWYVDLMISGSILKGLKDPGITYSEPIQTFKTYLATNKKAPYPHMDKLEKAMETLRKSDKLEQIFKKYDVIPSY